MKLDILVFAAHPDDAELSCSGAILSHVNKGYKVGIVDLTRGELGSRGTAELRDQEAQDSAKILKLSARENLNLGDGLFNNEPETRLQVIKAIRKYRPEIVWANSLDDRHPDHGRGAKLVNDACFYSGLKEIKTDQEHWRPKQLFHYIQDRYINPDVVVDVSDFWEERMKSVYAFKTQFYNPEVEGPTTPISSKEFIDFLYGRAREFGRPIGADFGEGFIKSRTLGITNFFDLV